MIKEVKPKALKCCAYDFVKYWHYWQLKNAVYHSYSFVKINRNLLAKCLVDSDLPQCSQKLPYDKHFHYVIWNTCILAQMHVLLAQWKLGNISTPSSQQVCKAVR